MVSQDGAVQEPKTAPLSRSGSLYNLTLDEVQNQLGNFGKPLGSMNLDELLKSVWSVEAGEASGLDFGGDDTNMQHSQHASGGYSLNSQGSINLSGDLSKKTVDEVWRDMQLKKTVDQEREPTLGEMTLEDFLLKAGVVGESFNTKDNSLQGVDLNGDSQQNVSQHGNWIQYQLPSMQQPLQHQHGNHQNNMMVGFVNVHAIQPSFQVPGNSVMDAAMSPSSLMGTLSDTQTLSRKRFASGQVVEKTVERRQKRMIKNRESAARSRARKQVILFFVCVLLFL